MNDNDRKSGEVTYGTTLEMNGDGKPKSDGVPSLRMNLPGRTRSQPAFPADFVARFHVGDGHFVEVQHDLNGQVRVRTDRALYLRPVMDNVIMIGTRPQE